MTEKFITQILYVLENDVDRYKKYGHEVKIFSWVIKLNLVLDKINSREKEFTNQINEDEIAFISKCL